MHSVQRKPTDVSQKRPPFTILHLQVLVASHDSKVKSGLRWIRQDSPLGDSRVFIKIDYNDPCVSFPTHPRLINTQLYPGTWHSPNGQTTLSIGSFVDYRRTMYMDDISVYIRYVSVVALRLQFIF